MKRILLLAALLLGMSATAQMKIKEKGSNQTVWSSVIRSQSIERVEIDQDTLFVYTYQNLKYNYLTSFESFSFSGVDEILSFLDLCSQVIESGNQFEIKLKDESLSLKKRIKSVKITTSKGWLFLDNRNINKIREALQAG